MMDNVDGCIEIGMQGSWGHRGRLLEHICCFFPSPDAVFYKFLDGFVMSMMDALKSICKAFGVTKAGLGPLCR